MNVGPKSGPAMAGVVGPSVAPAQGGSYMYLHSPGIDKYTFAKEDILS